ncbi:hypothetical protein BAPA111461_08065 [Bacillus paramycoides]
MNQFFNDFINLTQGQLLVKYWWLWLIIICSTIFVAYLRFDRNG